MYSDIEQFATNVKLIPLLKRVSVNGEKLDEIIELAKQWLSEWTKSDRLQWQMRNNSV